MSYVLEPDEALGRGIARIIAGQVGKLREACAENAGGDGFVHRARVRCKRIRAALRLARPLMAEKDYARENAFWRDAGRELSSLRDLSARVEALDALRPLLDQEAGAAGVKRLETRFRAERDGVKTESAGTSPIFIFCDRVAQATADLEREIEPGDAEALVRALGRGYAAARRQMKAALRKGTPEAFHDWRKQAKYHALHVRLSRKVFPVLEDRVKAARDLGEHLGAVQDIEVVLQGLSPRAVRLRRALEARRAMMMGDAFQAGEDLFGVRRRTWLKSLEPAAEMAAATE